MTFNDRLSSERLVHRLRGLTMAAAVLHVGAHPDDEEAGLASYLSRGLGIRAVYWSATRGEGGQNRAGPERGEALGIVRTWESLAARDVDGGEVLFGPFFDFGFSKTPEATLRRWGRDELVAEIVRAIRIVQPLVLISRWSGGPTDGHGHHQAVGLATVEAFEAAGDPDRFPELTRSGYLPWQPQKLYHSMEGDWQPDEDREFGQRRPDYDAAGLLAINAGRYDPVTGASFQEIAAEGLNRHLSQGMAVLPTAGDYFYYYRRIRSLVAAPSVETSFFDGLDPTLTGLVRYPGAAEEIRGLLEEAESEADAALRMFRPDRPETAATKVLRVVSLLRRAQFASSGLLSSCLATKIKVAEETAARCLGISLEGVLQTGRATPGSVVRVATRLISRGLSDIAAATVELRVPDGWAVEEAGELEVDKGDSGMEKRATFDVVVPGDAQPSCPYWLRTTREPYRYHWPDQGSLAIAFDDPLVTTAWTIDVEGERITIEETAVRKEPIAGGVRELPLQVLPPVSIEPRKARVLVPAQQRWSELELQVVVRSLAPGELRAPLLITAPEGWEIRSSPSNVILSGAGQDGAVNVNVRIPPMSGDTHTELRYEIELGGRRYGDVLRPVRRGPHGSTADATNCTEETWIVTPAALSVDVIDVRFVDRLKYAYIPGMVEDILPSLDRFGLDVTVLSGSNLAYADFGRYDAIVVGPNAYILRDEVRSSARRLLDYVDSGGTLIVQYQAYPYSAPGLAPFPVHYNQPHDRVTSADAPVTLLKPEHPLLNLPNPIGPEDFDGWVHDRGLYFMREWDRRYEALLSCHDEDDEPRAGGLLCASYGRGTYVYAAYSFHRQIPAGVAGATRLFANLLGLAEAKIVERANRLAQIDLFEDMTDEQLFDVARVMSERWPEDGTYLCREGDRDSDLFLILDGEVEVIKEKTGQVVAVAKRGGAVGEIAALGDLARSATLRANDGAKLLVMRGKDFRSLIDARADIAARFVRVLARKLAASRGPL